MGTRAVFPKAPAGARRYESFYLRAVPPDQPLGVWIRYTVHKRGGQRPKGSLWCTVFDGRRGRPFMQKLTSDRLSVPAGGWVQIGDGPGEGGRMGAGAAEGDCGDAHWALRFDSEETEL